MRIQAIIAHPRRSSFCYALFDRAVQTLSQAGHDLIVHDLYAEGFDPVLREDEAFTVGDEIEDALSRSKDPIVNSHRQELALVDGLLVCHPNWWGKPPAMCGSGLLVDNLSASDTCRNRQCQ